MRCIEGTCKWPWETTCSMGDQIFLGALRALGMGCHPLAPSGHPREVAATLSCAHPGQALQYHPSRILLNHHSLQPAAESDSPALEVLFPFPPEPSNVACKQVTEINKSSRQKRQANSNAPPARCCLGLGKQRDARSPFQLEMPHPIFCRAGY